MKLHLRYLVLVALPLALAACGDDDGGQDVDIRGLTADEQADVAADALCDWAAECGQVSYDCSSDGTTTTCTGTIETTTYQACYAETEPDMLEDFQGCTLTADQEATINGCLNAMVAEPCLTQDQVDANAAAMEQGEDPPYGGDAQAACTPLGAIFDSCDATPQ